MLLTILILLRCHRLILRALHLCKLVPEPADMETEDASMVPTKAEFDRRFKRGPPTTAEELETEIRSEHDEAAFVAAYCFDFTCSDTGEPMASV